MKNTICVNIALFKNIQIIFLTISFSHHLLLLLVKTLCRMHYFWSFASRSFRVGGVHGSGPLGVDVSRLPLARPGRSAPGGGRASLGRGAGAGSSVSGRSRTRTQVLLVYSL